MNGVVERRFISGTSLRTSGDRSTPRISGTAARFGVLSHDLGGWKERIKPGAFTRSLQSDRDVMCLVNHSPDRVLGRRKNSTLFLAEDERGLHFSCLLPNTSDGRDVHELIKRSDLSECSFAFQVDPDGEEWGEEDDPEDRGCKCRVRTLRSCRLFDVSVVAQPAYPSTSVNVSADPMTMDGGSAFSPRDLFPQGLPAEVRNHLGTAVLNTTQERRRRLTNLFVG
jgi:HK97 family phage prohead protease